MNVAFAVVAFTSSRLFLVGFTLLISLASTRALAIGVMCYNRDAHLVSSSVRDTLVVAEGEARQKGRCSKSYCRCRWFQNTCMAFVWGEEARKVYWGEDQTRARADETALSECYQVNHSCYSISARCD